MIISTPIFEAYLECPYKCWFLREPVVLEKNKKADFDDAISEMFSCRNF